MTSSFGFQKFSEGPFTVAFLSFGPPAHKNLVAHTRVPTRQMSTELLADLPPAEGSMVNKPYKKESS